MQIHSWTLALCHRRLTNIRTVLAFPDLIPVKTRKFEDELAKGLPVATKRAAAEGKAHGIMQFCSNGILFGVGMFIGFNMIDAGWIEYIDMMGAFMAVLFGGQSLGMGLGAMAELQAAKLAANKFFVVKERDPAIRKPTNSMNAIKSDSSLVGRIEFKNVTFSYQTAPTVKVLDDVSFDVPAGSSLAIVGPSGSGKSTVISLIERFYDYDSGCIVMDGSHPINDYDLSYLRSSIGLVSQMPLLFDTTITENIRGGLMTATKEDIEEAAKSANAHDFIMKLDDGYETMVGELGGKLSVDSVNVSPLLVLFWRSHRFCCWMKRHRHWIPNRRKRFNLQSMRSQLVDNKLRSPLLIDLTRSRTVIISWFWWMAK